MSDSRGSRKRAFQAGAHMRTLPTDPRASALDTQLVEAATGAISGDPAIDTVSAARYTVLRPSRARYSSWS